MTPRLSPSFQSPQLLLAEQALLDEIAAAGGPACLYDAVSAAERAVLAGVDQHAILLTLNSIGISKKDWDGNLRDRQTFTGIFSVTAGFLAAVAAVVALSSCNERHTSPASTPEIHSSDASSPSKLNLSQMFQAEGIPADILR